MRSRLLVLAMLLTAAPCGAVERTLDNGLRVVLIPHRANPMVASAVIVGAGVVDEPSDASGASHFLEHLLFNGTITRSQKQLYDEVDRMGAYNNATTREDHTLFTLLVAKEHAEEGLAIQTDMLFRSTLPEENFEKERKIVLEELARDRSDPGYDIDAAFRASAFAGTPIARPVLGTEASLGAITRSQVLGYYKARYVPANMTLVVMGDFENDEMLAAVQRTFGAVAAKSLPASKSSAWPPAPKENVELAPAAGGSTRLLAAFPFPGAPWDRTTVAAEILLAAASQGKDSPFGRALASRGLTSAAPSLGIERRRAPWSTVALDVEVPPGTDATSVLDAMLDALRSTRSGGEARARLPLVLARAASDAVIARDQIHYFAMLRSSSIHGSPKGSVDGADAVLTSLTPDDWDQASARLLAGVSAVRARLAGPDLAQGKVSWAPAADSRRPVTDSASRAARAGALSNGLRYVVRESADSDVFALHLAFVPRAAGEPEGKDGITDLLHRIMLRGTSLHEPAALEERLARLGARVKTVDDPMVPYDDYYTTPEFSWLRLEVPGSNWRDALGTVAEMLRFPALTTVALDEARHDAEERVRRREGSPRDVAVGALDALLAPGSALLRPVYGTRASLDAVTLDDLKAYHDRTIVGRRQIVTVVGPVAAGEVIRALEADLGSLPEGDPQESVAPIRVPVSVPAIPASAEIGLGKTQAYLAVGRLLDVAGEDKTALVVAVAMLSDRLAFALRETKGLAYSIGASVRPWGGRMRFEVAMGTRAENLADARSGILDGIRAFREASPEAADVGRAVNGARGAALMRRMTRISLAYEAGVEAMRGEEPGDEMRFVDALRGVRAEDVKRVAAAYLDPDRLSLVTVR